MTTQAQSVAIGSSQFNSSGVLQVAGGGTGTTTSTGSGSVVLSASPTLTGTLTAATISASADATIHGLTVGLGGGAVSTNTAVGYQAGYNNTTGGIDAFGYYAGLNNTTGSANVAIGQAALKLNSTSGSNTAVGFYALANATSANNTAVGSQAAISVIGGSDNTAIGQAALLNTNSGAYNVAVGSEALKANTTASNNTAVGYQAGYSNTTGTNNFFGGYLAGYANQTGFNNVYIGTNAGVANTGSVNTFVGQSSGYLVTSGTGNTILGAFDGYNFGPDIRTASNYIVLSDGSGNARGIFDNNGSFITGKVSLSNPYVADGLIWYKNFSGSGGSLIATNGGTGTAMQVCVQSNVNLVNFLNSATQCGSITATGLNTVIYQTTSDYRLKNNVTSIDNGVDTIKKLNPVNFTWDSDNRNDSGFLAHEFQAVIPNSVTGEKDAVDEDGKPIYQQMDNSGVVPFLVAAIKELSAKNDALEARLAVLEAK